MEFMQFHPTVLYIAGSSPPPASPRPSAARGPTSATATATASCPSITRAPSSPRATTSRGPSSPRWRRRSTPTSTSTCRTSTRPASAAASPASTALCQGFDLDITRDPIPVRPGAHYMVGGVTVDLDGRTTLPGLWAAGEVDQLRPPRRQPAGLEQPARRAGLRRPGRRGHRRRPLDDSGPRRLEVPPDLRAARRRRPASRSTWPTSATRSAP